MRQNVNFPQTCNSFIPAFREVGTRVNNCLLAKVCRVPQKDDRTLTVIFVSWGSFSLHTRPKIIAPKIGSGNCWCQFKVYLWLQWNVHPPKSDAGEVVMKNYRTWSSEETKISAREGLYVICSNSTEISPKFRRY